MGRLASLALLKIISKMSLCSTYIGFHSVPMGFAEDCWSVSTGPVAPLFLFRFLLESELPKDDVPNFPDCRDSFRSELRISY